MTFGSLFTGVGGFDLGFEQAGMRCLWQCEIDKQCQQLLKSKFGVPVHDDVTTFRPGPIDLICGGFPCQDLSVAGRRAGLAGARSGLFYEFIRILRETAAIWCVIENVPGLLSSHRGRDFALVLHELGQLGYRIAWRVLDSQYFGLAQRRKRLFIVGHLGDGRAAQVLFESDSLRRDYPPLRAQGKVAPTLFALGAGTSRPAGVASESEFCVEVAPTVRARTGSNGSPERGDMAVAFGWNKSQSQGMRVDAETTDALQASPASNPAIAFAANQRDEIRTMDVAGALAAEPGMKQQTFVHSGGVRRLLPIECERLQGFPDGWTEGFADTTRYRMLGNAVSVPVARWIGDRIMRCGE